MTWLTLAVALAADGPPTGFVHRVSREPLPARLVERPLVCPTGWTELRLGVARTRWPHRSLRPVPGELVRSEATASLRTSVGGGVELAATVPWVDLSTGTVAGSGLGSSTVGLAWMPGRDEAPARSVSLGLSWTAPSAHPRLPLGSATHQLRPALRARVQWGGLRLTGGVGARWAPEGPAAWLRDATGAVQRADPGDALLGHGEALLQAGFLWGELGVDGGWVGPDRLDGVVVTAAGLGGAVRQRGGLQLSRGLTVGVEGWQPLGARSPQLAPAADPLAPGTGLGAFTEWSL